MAAWPWVGPSSRSQTAVPGCHFSLHKANLSFPFITVTVISSGRNRRSARAGRATQSCSFWPRGEREKLSSWPFTFFIPLRPVQCLTWGDDVRAGWGAQTRILGRAVDVTAFPKQLPALGGLRLPRPSGPPGTVVTSFHHRGEGGIQSFYCRPPRASASPFGHAAPGGLFCRDAGRGLRWMFWVSWTERTLRSALFS